MYFLFFRGADRCYLCQPLFLPSLSLVFLLFRRRRQLCCALLLCALASLASAVAAEKKGGKKKKKNEITISDPGYRHPSLSSRLPSFRLFFFFFNPLRRDEKQQPPPPSLQGEVEGRGWVTVLPISTQLANNPPITELHSGEREREGEKCFSQKKRGSPRASVASLASQSYVASESRWRWGSRGF